MVLNIAFYDCVYVYIAQLIRCRVVAFAFCWCVQFEWMGFLPWLCRAGADELPAEEHRRLEHRQRAARLHGRRAQHPTDVHALLQQQYVHVRPALACM